VAREIVPVMSLSMTREPLHNYPFQFLVCG
jgi:hypothetical protein